MSSTISDIMLPEFEQETAKTSKLLTKVTAESMAFKPAETLHTIGWNANHLLDIVSWTADIIEKFDFDLSPIDGPPVVPANFTDPAELVRQYDQHRLSAIESLASATDEQMAQMWSLKMKGEVLLTISKGECIRTWVLNHTVHHRAILSVYLRIYGIEIISVYDA